MTLQITLLEALVGFSKTILHLDEHPVEIKRSSVTQADFVLEIQGEGMPIQKTSKFGNLFIHFHIIYPSELNDEEKQIVKKLLPYPKDEN